VLLGGVNVLESRDFALEVAAEYAAVCAELRIPLVFKASYDKANRSSIHSFRGPGLEAGLAMLAEIRDPLQRAGDHGCPRAGAGRAGRGGLRHHPAARVSRPPDGPGARDGRDGGGDQHQEAAVSVPGADGNIVEKFRECGNERLLICERGSNFGYDNLVVDMLGFGVMKQVTGDLP
jgi:2-dehydro-3-deoxyphosphooctonate aldolase (KDO 8-P synthase)